MAAARRFFLIARRLFFAALLLALIVVALAWWLMRASLALLDGEQRVAGLASSVAIERDAAGVPTVRATDRSDLYSALGFLHAQERFFQMDLARRAASGRLAELFGEVAVPADRRVRIHRLDAVADKVIEREPARRRAWLAAYADGVNAGLEALGARPFEYWLLGEPPAPWRPRDTVLVQFAMYLDLTDERAAADAHLGVLRGVVPADAFAWLTVDGGQWDAPIVGGPVAPSPLPATRWFGKRAAGSEAGSTPVMAEAAAGSNSWVVSGALTEHGGAMLANDMHLGLRVPNVWYRARLIEEAESGVLIDATGVTLPGAPGIIVGSNGHIAWGFTNSYGDWSDRVRLRAAPDAAERYLVEGGSEALEFRRETIAVRGGDDETFEVPVSRFGPVVEAVGGRQALRWLAHDPAASNFALLDMIAVEDVEPALDLANRSGIPPQNIVVAGRDGTVGWTIAGRMPRRHGYDPRLPVASDSPGGWHGWLAAEDYPRVVNPVSQRIWTANARVADLDDYAVIGRGRYPLGARAGQIRDRLFARERFGEADMLAIQLDDHSAFLVRWRTLLLEILSSQAVAGRAGRAELRRLVESGAMRASVDAVGYSLVRDFRGRVENTLMSWFLAPAMALDPEVSARSLSQREEAVWQAVSARAPHLLPPGHANWDSFLLAEIDAVIAGQPDTPLAERTWGRYNRVRVAHPLSRALPAFLARRLDMPTRALPGDAWLPRVQVRNFGASQRIVVAPGREENGIFHMPGGQSGHPLSPFYASDHEAWTRGTATPFLPGPTRYRLVLRPAAD